MEFHRGAGAQIRGRSRKASILRLSCGVFDSHREMICSPRRALTREQLERQDVISISTVRPISRVCIKTRDDRVGALSDAVSDGNV